MLYLQMKAKGSFLFRVAKSPPYVPYTCTTLSTTESGTNCFNSSNAASFSSFFFILAQSPLTNVELTPLYLGSPSKNTVLIGQILPSNAGP